MIKSLLIAASLLPAPDSPRAQAAFSQMLTDFSTCHAYYGLAADYYGIMNPQAAREALGAQVASEREAMKLEVLTGDGGEFARRRSAALAEMQRVLDSNRFSVLYSSYEGFCDRLKDDPGEAFLKRLPREIPHRRAPAFK